MAYLTSVILQVESRDVSAYLFRCYGTDIENYSLTDLNEKFKKHSAAFVLIYFYGMKIYLY